MYCLHLIFRQPLLLAEGKLLTNLTSNKSRPSCKANPKIDLLEA